MNPDDRQYRDECRRFETALRTEPQNDDLHFRYANLLREHGDVDQAVPHYESALSINPRHAEAHHNYGLLLKKLGRLQDARGQYEAALSIEPQSAQAAANLARLSAIRGDVESAIDNALRAIRLRSLPDNGFRITGWFARRHADLERVVADTRASTERRGGALAILIAERPENAAEVVAMLDDDPAFPDAGRVCSEILEIWNAQPTEND